MPAYLETSDGYVLKVDALFRIDFSNLNEFRL